MKRRMMTRRKLMVRKKIKVKLIKILKMVFKFPAQCKTMFHVRLFLSKYKERRPLNQNLNVKLSLFTKVKNQLIQLFNVNSNAKKLKLKHSNMEESHVDAVVTQSNAWKAALQKTQI